MCKSNRGSDLSRRSLLRAGVAGLGGSVFGLSLLSDLFMRKAYGLTPTNAFYDSVIQIFFYGGPSQTDTFDPKPGSVNNVFATNALGVNDKYGKPINLSNALAKITGVVQSGVAQLGVIRSLVHSSEDHSAAELITQSFWRTLGPAMLYPSIASVMAYYGQGLSPIGIPAVAFDNAVNDNKGNPIPTALNARSSSMGQVLNRPVTAARYDRRMRMLKVLNASVLSERPDPLVKAADAAWQEAYDITTKGTAAAAFNLTGKTILPGTYTSFARRLTQAQELVKAGVPYVSLNIDGNDSHEKNIAAINNVWTSNVDPAVAQLATNLKATGKRVLVIMGGEFGRTPKISTDPVALGDGRDHWADGFSWGLLSINQPKFKTGAWGDTGPDGVWTQARSTLVDPVEMKDLGGLIYRAMGFPPGNTNYDIPLIDRKTPAVDPVNKSSDLMGYFGLV